MASIDQLLKSMGPMSNENANRARGFYGANPDLLERRMLGLQGGGGRGGEGDMDLNAMLDQVIQQTATPQQQVQQQPLAPLPQQAAVAPAQRAPVPVPAQGGRGVAPPTEPAPGSMPPQDGAAAGGPGFADWLLSLLGVSSVAGRAAMAGRGAGNAVGDEVGRIAGPDPNAKRLTYQPKLENQGPTEVRNSPELEQKGQNRAENDMRVRNEVAADNATADEAMMRQIMQQNSRSAAQRQTQETINAAKRAVGRR